MSALAPAPISSSSLRTGLTNKQGEALLPISFKAGQTGRYVMRASLASAQSNAALRMQSFRGGLLIGPQQLSYSKLVSRARLKSQLRPIAPT